MTQLYLPLVNMTAQNEIQFLDLVLPSPFDPSNRPSVKDFLGQKKIDAEVAVKSTSVEKEKTNKIAESAPKMSQAKLSKNED